MYTVYIHTFPNGKRYVGVTRNSLEKRWGYRGRNYKTQFVGKAIEKYGWENVQHEVFCLCETKESAERVERFLVKHYDTTNALYGYNILQGGDVSVNDATPEMRYKLGNGNRGKPHTEEQKRKISEGCKRRFNRPESNGCIGKHASDETKAKMREAHKNIAKPVLCYTQDGEFVARYRTINEAHDKTGAGTGAISMCCRGIPRFRTAKGFIWKYESE